MIKTERKKRRRFIQGVMALALALSIGLVCILYSNEISIPATQSYEGVIELYPESSLNVSFSSLTISGFTGPFDPTYMGNGFRWEEDEVSRIQRLYLSSSQAERLIRIWSSNGTFTESTITSFTIDYWSIRNCSRLAVGNLDFKLTSSHRFARLRIENAERGIQILPLSFDALRGNEFLSVDLIGRERTNESFVSMTCDYPLLTIDGQSIQFNGTTIIYLKHFSSIEGTLSLGEDSSIGVYGDLNLKFTNARADGKDTGGYVATHSANYDLQEGFAIVDSTEVVIDIGRDEFEITQQREPIRLRVEVLGSVLFVEESGKLHPTSTITWREDLIRLDNTTKEVLSIILSLLLAIPIFWLADFAKDYVLIDRYSYLKGGNRRVPLRTRIRSTLWFNRPSKSKLIGFGIIVAVIILLVILLIYVVSSAFVGAIYGTKPIPYYYGENDVHIKVSYEEGVDLDLVNVTVFLFKDQIERLLDTDVPSISWDGFPDDGLEYYDSGDKRIYDPVGSESYDFSSIMATGIIEYHIIFKRGYGKGFAGLNNYGPVTIIPVQEVEDPVVLLDTLMHEFGHALMLKHRTCSPLMTDKPNLSEPTLPSHISILPGYLFRGVPILEQAKEGSITGFEDWGTEIGRLVNRSIDLEDFNRTVTRNTYLFYDATTGEIHEVVYWMSRDHSTGEVDEAAWIQRVPTDAYAHSFSVGEYLYLLEGLLGHEDAREAKKHFC